MTSLLNGFNKKDYNELIHLKNHFISYSYAYPHKTAYRFLDTPISLKSLWAEEEKNALFLYIHLPFCKKKCYFCNLFSFQTNDKNLIDNYIQTVKKQAEVIYNVLNFPKISRFAIGGGTPTYLSLKQLKKVFEIASDIFKIEFKKVPISIELSPMTATEEIISFLREYHIDRVSIGIQSFLDNEAKILGRLQTNAMIHNTLSLLRDYNFPDFNIDLIYGIPTQNKETFLESIRQTIEYKPSEIYLYPLYIRSLTSLYEKVGKSYKVPITLYQVGRDFLINNGYQQLSMRNFSLLNNYHINHPKYKCQEDGMIGLGCGSRSYTQAFHYSDDYATSSKAIKNILLNFLNRNSKSFKYAHHGIELSLDDQKRRYIIKSILKKPGLNLNDYKLKFYNDAISDFAKLNTLLENEILINDNGNLNLTKKGLEYSDIIGPWFYSDFVINRMCSYRAK